MSRCGTLNTFSTICPAVLLRRSAKPCSPIGSFPPPTWRIERLRDNAAFLAILLELKAGAALQKGAYGEALSALEGILDFSRFLPEERKSDYAYGASELKGILTSTGAKNVTGQLKAIFGGQMKEGQSFYAEEGKAPAAYREILALVREPARFGHPIEAGQTAKTSDFKAGISWGTLSFDWLPSGATVSFGKTSIDLTKADDGRMISGGLPPGSYDVAVWANGLQYGTKIQVVAGTERRVDRPMDYLLKVYAARRRQALNARSSRLTTGRIFLGLGVAGLGAVAYLYNRGSTYYTDYQNAATNAVADADRYELSSIGNYILYSGIASGIGLLVGSATLASVPPQAQIEANVAEIDRQIKTLQERRINL